MKKFILASVLSCFAIAINAQSFRFGPTLNAEYVNPSGDNKAKAGLSIGLRGEMSLTDQSEGVFLEALVLYDMKNWRSNTLIIGDNPNNIARPKASVQGITIPVNVGYRVAASPSANILFSLGPYINIGIDGKEEIDAADIPTETTSKVITDNVYSDDYMQRINWGLNLKVTGEFLSHYLLSVGYDIGLNNIYKSKYFNGKARTLYVGVGYMF